MQFILHLIEKILPMVEEFSLGINHEPKSASILTNQNKKYYELQKMDPARYNDRSIISNSFCERQR